MFNQTFFAFIVLISTLSVSNAQTDAAKITLTFQSPFPESSKIYDLEKAWIAQLYELTDGEVSGNFVPGNSVVENNDLMEAVELGAVDGHTAYIGYFSSADPAYMLLADMVGVFDETQDAMMFVNSDEFKTLMKKVHPKTIVNLGAYTTGMDSLSSKKKIATIADFKGVSLRAPQGIVRQTLQELGANPIDMLIRELAPSLTSNTIQAADYATLANNYHSGIVDVAPFVLYPGVHSMAVHEVAISKAKWDNISPKRQKIILDSVKKLAANILDNLEREDKRAAEQLRKNKKYTVVDWAKAERQKYNATVLKTRAKIAKSSSKARAVEYAIKAYLKK